MTSPTNEQIAREVGWTVDTSMGGKAVWVGPGGELSFDPPDFLHSVDAHIEWTVPKAKEMGYALYFHCRPESTPPSVKNNLAYFIRTRGEYSCFSADADTPALAICAAWELLMEEVEGG